MNTVEIKKYIKKQIDIADDRTLRMIQAIIDVDKQQDWWETLSDNQKKIVTEGLEQAKKDNFVSSTTIKNKFGSWLTE
ncbi:MAG: hypothetical protein R2739_06140 [Chitinophagales bacterium]|nr:hypothetical protein [Bacteroidota bacterium]